MPGTSTVAKTKRRSKRIAAMKEYAIGREKT
jgi:hypothetical protein